MWTAWLVSALAAVSGASGDNVLVILMDDVSNRLVEAYEEGVPGQMPATPHITALAADGLRFNNCYANPLCSPTRATIVTGRYAYRTGIGQVIKSVSGVALPFAEVTLAETLAPAGYSNAMIGKWHLGSRGDAFDPILQGWDAFIGTTGNLGNYYTYRETMAFAGGLIQERYTRYSTTRITDQTIQAIQILPEPWSIMVWFHAPHNPMHVPPDELYDRPGPPRTQYEQYLTMVEAMDTEIGRLLEHVDFGNTTVMLLADNGATTAILEERGKSTMHEPGINVPLIVAGSAVPAASRGAVTEALVNTTDLYATTLEIAGVVSTAEDSISFVPVLADPTLSPRTMVLSERFQPNLPPQGSPPSLLLRSVRERRYKLIRDELTGQEEMYDLKTAPPDQDGPMLDLLNLTSREQRAYKRMSTYLDSLPTPAF